MTNNSTTDNSQFFLLIQIILAIMKCDLTLLVYWMHFWTFTYEYIRNSKFIIRELLSISLFISQRFIDFFIMHTLLKSESFFSESTQLQLLLNLMTRIL